MMYGSLVRAARLGSGVGLALLMAVSVSPGVRGHASAPSQASAVSGQARSSAAVVKVNFEQQDNVATRNVAHRNW